LFKRSLDGRRYRKLRGTPAVCSVRGDHRRLLRRARRRGDAAHSVDRNPACQTALGFAVLSAASFKGARTIARDEVTSCLREPFVKGDAHEGDDDPV
jgi:hypothetical protein